MDVNISEIGIHRVTEMEGRDVPTGKGRAFSCLTITSENGDTVRVFLEAGEAGALADAFNAAREAGREKTDA